MTKAALTISFVDVDFVYVCYVMFFRLIQYRLTRDEDASYFRRVSCVASEQRTPFSFGFKPIFYLVSLYANPAAIAAPPKRPIPHLVCVYSSFRLQ